jgi:hypothetical protein
MNAVTSDELLKELRAFPTNGFMLRAADEIERLRNERNAFEAERDELISISNKLKRERDEARRSVCEMSIQLGGVYRRVGGKNVEVTTPEGCAEIMRWDCFKEKA